MIKRYNAIPEPGERVHYLGRECRVGRVFRSDAAPRSGWLVELEPQQGQGIGQTGSYMGFVDAATVERIGEGAMTQAMDDVGLLLRAIAFAADKHRNQRRKDAEATPYINHPIALANVLKEEGGIDDPVVLAAAILHDTIEDTQTTPYELEMAFGQKIAGIVQELTDDKSLPKAVRKQLQIDHAAAASHEAKLVKLADKICNLRDISASPPADWSEERKRDYFEWAAKVVAGCRGCNAKLEALFDHTMGAITLP